MHSYSIDSTARRSVYYILAVGAALLPSVVASLSTSLSGLLRNSPHLAWPLGMGATFGALFFLFDRYIWTYATKFHRIPDLNGTWIGEGLSSYQPAPDGSLQTKFSLTVKIRQTFTRLEVFTESTDSTSRSTMASISSDHTHPIIRYAFENTPKSKAATDLQRHPGLIDLRLEEDGSMVGDYFSGKHRLRYGELKLTRTKDYNGNQRPIHSSS